MLLMLRMVLQLPALTLQILTPDCRAYRSFSGQPGLTQEPQSSNRAEFVAHATYDKDTALTVYAKVVIIVPLVISLTDYMKLH